MKMPRYGITSGRACAIMATWWARTSPLNIALRRATSIRGDDCPAEEGKREGSPRQDHVGDLRHGDEDEAHQSHYTGPALSRRHRAGRVLRGHRSTHYGLLLRSTPNDCAKPRV